MKPQTVTKKKVHRKNAKSMTYQDVRREVEKPFAERKEVPIGRGKKMRIPRKHHLTDDEKLRMKKDAERLGAGCVNPFRGRAGLYFGQVEALIQLGVDEWHSFKATKDKIAEILSAEKSKDGRSAWDNAINRKPREKVQAPKSIDGRIMTNFRTLQRLPDQDDKNPYGTKLLQFGLCIDIEYRKANELSAPVPYYRLNTNGLSLKQSMKAEELLAEGKLEVHPINVNPFSKRGPKPGSGKKPKSKDDSVAEPKSGEDKPKKPAKQKTTKKVLKRAPKKKSKTGAGCNKRKTKKSAKSEPVLKLVGVEDEDDRPNDAKFNDFVESAEPAAE